MEKHVAAEKLNPFKLPLNTVFYSVTVELISLKAPGDGGAAGAGRDERKDDGKRVS